MKEWCSAQLDSTIGGMLALFCIFHLPRTQHVELLSQITRILKEDAPILFTVPQDACEGFQQKWFGNNPMYWSSFSEKWYEITCEDLGLDFISKTKDVKIILGKEEATFYFLFKKRNKG
eukprot:TRINITY_DN7099_c0_g1_i1.p2 TRINITY_DN7099_c0_g1~~TRINITY_DN7099_c0_g1_i1.p2  ORF type:complete len:119 (+),score=10.93 TRINITY_DN7099_c0_g1_i1:368-724(+)